MTQRPLAFRDLQTLNGKTGGAPVGPHLLTSGSKSSGSAAQAKFGNMMDGWISMFRRSVVATLSVVGGSGGATDGTCSLTVTDVQAQPVDEEKEVLIIAQATQYEPGEAPVSTVTFSAATLGTIVDSGNGWALIQTSAAGQFACTVSDSADETIYFSAAPPSRGGSDATGSIACVSVVSNADDATWAA